MDTIDSSLLADSVNLTNCDREVIHIPGAIQPHALLVVTSLEFRILQISENVKDYLQLDLTQVLGRELDTILSIKEIKCLKKALKNLPEKTPSYIFSKKLKNQVHGALYACSVHKDNDFLMLEFEPEEGFISEKSLRALTEENFAKKSLEIVNAQSTKELIQNAVKIAKKISGFHRVVLYQFDEHGDCVIRGQARDAHMNSFLGHHFPSADIPLPARKMLLSKRASYIPDIQYIPIRVIPQFNPITQKPTDLTHVYARDVSKMATQFYKNMNLRATYVISLTVQGKLWGAISCHHTEIKLVSRKIKNMLIYLGDLICMTLGNIQEKERVGALVTQTEKFNGLIKNFHKKIELHKFFSENMDRFKSFFDSVTFALSSNNQIYVYGTPLSKGFIKDFLNWLSQNLQLDQTIFSSDCLSKVFPQAIDFKGNASGCLAIVVSRNPELVLIWFRPEQIKIKKWAGEPHKESSNPGEILTPRVSFEAWKEKVKNTSQAWTNNEIYIAQALRVNLVDFVLGSYQEIMELTHQLKRSNEDLAAFAYVASHDLKEPLRGIHNYANIIRENPENSISNADQKHLIRISELTHKMDLMINSLLKFSELNQGENFLVKCSFNKIIKNVEARLHFLLMESKAILKIQDRFPEVFCDPQKIEEVFYNLIQNGIKYNDKNIKIITIGFKYISAAQNKAPEILYYVKDNGIGISKEHAPQVFKLFKRLHPNARYGGGTGVGLTIVKKLIESHGGKIWIQSTVGKGTNFYFKIPNNIPGIENV